MTELFPKFIIEDGCLIMMNVKYHSQIVNNKNKVTGGGWFRFDGNSNACIFYGESLDYGKAKLEHIKDCVWNGKVFINPPQIRCLAGKYKFYYDTGVEIIELETNTVPATSPISSFLFRLAGMRYYKPAQFLAKAAKQLLHLY